MASLRAVLTQAAARLAAAGVDSPRLSAELLLAHALGIPRERLILALDEPLSEAAAFEALIKRREAGEPVAYLLGHKEFYGLDFAVGPAVLIPRPETELLVELALAAFPPDMPLSFADLGTGSGILAVTLAHERPLWHGAALDISPDALDMARANARTHGVAERLSFIEADFTKALPVANLDIIVSNPPYVSGPEYAAVSHEVRNYEPALALTPGPSGLEALAALLPNARQALAPGGLLLVEIGCEQGPAAQELAARHGFTDIRLETDLAGLDRVLWTGM